MNDIGEELNFHRGRFGSEVLPRFDLLVGLCNEFYGYCPSFLRDFAATGTGGLVDSSDLSSHWSSGPRRYDVRKELIVCSFLGRMERGFGRYLDRRRTEEEINEQEYL
jgi:hypothetical protein